MSLSRARAPSTLLEQYLAVQEANRPCGSAAPAATAWWRAVVPATAPTPPLPACCTGDASATACTGALAISHLAISSPSPTADALGRYELLLAEAMAQLEADGIVAPSVKGPSVRPPATTVVDRRASVEAEFAEAALAFAEVAAATPPVKLAPRPAMLAAPTADGRGETTLGDHQVERPRVPAVEPELPAAPQPSPQPSAHTSTALLVRAPLMPLADQSNLPTELSTTKRKLHAFRRLRSS